MITERYFDWLHLTVEHPFRDYVKLLRVMFETEFVALIPNDQNRAEDVEELRRTFMYEMSENEELDIPVSVLEVMITLSERMYDLTYDPETMDHKPHSWFWTLVSNLELADYEDQEWGPASGEEIEHILKTMINRNYAYNGSGGLFPLAYPEQDQRDVELWYQMQYWVADLV
jgi:hypothetical protein